VRARRHAKKQNENDQLAQSVAIVESHQCVLSGGLLGSFATCIFTFILICAVDPLDATVITNDEVPGAVGVPLKLSDDPDTAMVIPAGSDPELTAAV